MDVFPISINGILSCHVSDDIIQNKLSKVIPNYTIANLTYEFCNSKIFLEVIHFYMGEAEIEVNSTNKLGLLELSISLEDMSLKNIIIRQIVMKCLCIHSLNMILDDDKVDFKQLQIVLVQLILKTGFSKPNLRHLDLKNAVQKIIRTEIKSRSKKNTAIDRPNDNRKVIEDAEIDSVPRSQKRRRMEGVKFIQSSARMHLDQSARIIPKSSTVPVVEPTCKIVDKRAINPFKRNNVTSGKSVAPLSDKVYPCAYLDMDLDDLDDIVLIVPKSSTVPVVEPTCKIVDKRILNPFKKNNATSGKTLAPLYDKTYPCVFLDKIISQIIKRKNTTISPEERRAEYINFLNRILVSQETVEYINAITTGQHKNEFWSSVRIGRVTASIMYRMICSINNGEVTQSFLTNILSKCSVKESNNEALQWGRKNEENAIKSYQLIKNVTVTKCGFCIDRAGLLGCSPDGIVDDTTIIEVKCPFTLKNSKFEVAISDKNCPLVMKNGKMVIRLLSHWHQVQSSLYITHRQFCDFVVWTPKWTKILRVNADPHWRFWVPQITDFYGLKIFPEMIKKYVKSTVHNYAM